MADRCEMCPALRAENAMLRSQITLLQATISRLIGGTTGTIALIDNELEEPTMPRHQLIPVVRERLVDVLSSAY
ncbi:hypothetical protein [Micromonospora sp. DT47]|uniref:hypothetical protein n=1 Tax=Micromonospora sp. DT47 TaxID=3393431 RepID=UPI003CE6A5C5